MWFVHRIVSVFFFALLGFGVHAEQWASPIEKKYEAINPELFQEVLSARQLLDSWQGQALKLYLAEVRLAAVIKADPLFAPAYKEYARFHIMARSARAPLGGGDELSPAESAILQALNFDPDYAEAYILLGHFYTTISRFDDAAAALQNAAIIGTQSPWLHLRLAELAQSQGDNEEALQSYYLTLEHTAADPRAHAKALAGITRIYETVGDYDSANKSYLAELAYAPDDAAGWGRYSSFLLFAYNDVDAAIEKARKALLLENSQNARFVLSCALYAKWAMLEAKAGVSSAAQGLFNEALAIYPYPKRAMREMSRYPSTAVAAAALAKFVGVQEQ